MTPGELVGRASFRELIEILEFDALEPVPSREDFCVFFADLIAKVHNASGNYKTALDPRTIYPRAKTEAERQNDARFYAAWRLGQLRARAKHGEERRRPKDH